MKTSRFVHPSLVGLGLTLFASGCTLNQYEISHAELDRLARAEPAERGQRVQVLQQAFYDQDSLRADTDEARAADNATLIVLGNTAGRAARNERSSNDDDEAADFAAAALAAFLAASVLLAPAAVTEGVRHDGWAKLEEDQPLYLVSQQRWVSLAELTPEDAAMNERAVAPGWGGRVEPLERRPLDRVGFAYTLEFGSASLPRADEATLLGYGGRLSLGGHPIQQLGVFVGGQFAYGSRPEDARFLGKVFGAVEFLPAELGLFHAGLYAEGGISQLVHTSATTLKSSGPFLSAGPVFQLALSTRLALTLRAGMTNVVGEDGRVWLPEAALGFAVY